MRLSEMIDWVKDELREWGYQVSRKPKGWPPLTLLGRIIELSPAGAMATGKRDFVPKGISMGKSLKAHRIVLAMPHDLREVAFVKYAVRGITDKQRAQKLNLSRRIFYTRLECAHYFFLGNTGHIALTEA